MYGPSPPTRGSPMRQDPANKAWRSIPAYTGQPLKRGMMVRPMRVHPRLHGAAARLALPRRRQEGPSPPTRGSHPRRAMVLVEVGSIPAYTGQPATAGWSTTVIGVHPRLHGAARGVHEVRAQTHGPSPPTRGSLPTHARADRRSGSIPAYTGQPPMTPPAMMLSQVHPRLHGAASTTCTATRRHRGPSPPTRGSQQHKRRPHARIGSIPAYTGQPMRDGCAVRLDRVHPRLHGAARASYCCPRSSCGPSPPTRGSRLAAVAGRPVSGSIPAYTGQPAHTPRTATAQGVHPRLHGAAADERLRLGVLGGPSPPTRGSPIVCRCAWCARRSIPAYTGQPSTGTATRRHPAVHPRLHGAAPAPTGGCMRWGGPSPPTRGSPLVLEVEHRCFGSIPAYTGQPVALHPTTAPVMVHPRLHGAAP